MTPSQSPETRFRLRKSPTQARAVATVDAVLEAAARILVESGYATASTNLIAERAGVSIGTLYEYFPGKEAIFAELRRRISVEHYETLTALPRPTNPQDMLRHIITNHIRGIREKLALHVTLETEVPRFAIEDTESAIIDDYVPQSNEFLAQHRAALKPKNNVPFITEFIMRVMSATVNDYAMRAPEALEGEELTEALIELLSGYLLKTDKSSDGR